jgi:glutathione S-transferase
MKLFYTPNSPFARKVRVIIRERNALQTVEEIIQAPLQDPVELRVVNPLGQVPVLLLGDGRALFDSPVICEYLDANLPGPALLAQQADARWLSLRQQALADGMMAAGVATVFESLRPDAQRSPLWINRWRTAIESGLAMLESEAPGFGPSLSFGGIATACALSYIGFRLPAIAWQERAPQLAHWAADVLRRPAFMDTAPQA